jgi:hypothetical protein
MVLRNALAEAPDLSGELGDLFLRDVLSDAISVVSFGIVGTAFCIGAHAHARRLTRTRLEATDRMIERLEQAVSQAPNDQGAEQAEDPEVGAPTGENEVCFPANSR